MSDDHLRMAVVVSTHLRLARVLIRHDGGGKAVDLSSHFGQQAGIDLDLWCFWKRGGGGCGGG
jgi:hypothetical protein